MKKKLSSYQKLKAENLALRQDLRTLVMWDDPLPGRRRLWTGTIASAG
jgi:hypothetical protein